MFSRYVRLLSINFRIDCVYVDISILKNDKMDSRLHALSWAQFYITCFCFAEIANRFII